MAEKRRAPIKKVTLTLDGEGYEGWKFEARTNPPWGVIEDLYDADDLRTVREALSSVILSWNFVDEDGNPIPAPAEDKESLRKVPSDLIQAVLTVYQRAVTETPNP